MKKFIQTEPDSPVYKMIVYFLLTVVLLIALDSFWVQQDDTEKLLGFSFNYDKKEVSIQVVSTGCSSKSDFVFEVKNNSITIFRKKKDSCKALPSVQTFLFSMKETGIDPDKTYSIKNNFIGNHYLANIH